MLRKVVFQKYWNLWALVIKRLSLRSSTNSSLPKKQHNVTQSYVLGGLQNWVIGQQVSSFLSMNLVSIWVLERRRTGGVRKATKYRTKRRFRSMRTSVFFLRWPLKDTLQLTCTKEGLMQQHSRVLLSTKSFPNVTRILDQTQLLSWIMLRFTTCGYILVKLTNY